ncbi:MAG: VacJ family lipoprotein [Lentisphaeria bacterium]
MFSSLACLAAAENNQEDTGPPAEEIAVEQPQAPGNDGQITVYDPLEPVNRVFFTFNDKLHFWLLKPTTKVYLKIVPATARQGIKNFFQNITTPVRTANALLQGELDSAITTGARFSVNSTAGVLGLMDPAAEKLELPLQKRDFGQTLGKYHIPYGIYLTWPILGPASIRSSAGKVGDYFLNPVSYMDGDIRSVSNPVQRINDLSFELDKYDKLRKAPDPYTRLRDSFLKNREKLIEKTD